MKTSVQYKLLYGLFKAIGVNKMLDKEGPDFDKLLKSCRKKQEKPLKVPYKKMQGFDIETKGIDGTTCYDALLGRDGVCTGSEISAAGVLCGAEVTEK